MKIGIIGAGFYGCYIANRLSKKHDVTIFEKNSSLLSEAAKKNQYRLHQGYHYPRCKKTINQTFQGYKKFKKEFKEYLYFPKNNYYLIHKNSLIDYSTYTKSMSKNLKLNKINASKIKYIKNPQDYLGAVNTKEGVILLDKLLPNLGLKIKKNCDLKLNSFVKRIVADEARLVLANKKEFKFDFIINCTYTNPNLGLNKKNKFNLKYELAALVVPTIKIKNISGITIMDGKFVSLYPRNRNSFSISSVKYTPVKKFSKLSQMFLYLKKMKIDTFKSKIKKKIIEDFNQYIDLKIRQRDTKIEFAIKTKFKDDKNDIRLANIRSNKKVLSVMSGKLDAAPIIFENINKYLKKL